MKSMREPRSKLEHPAANAGDMAEIAQQLNPLLRGWLAYYSRYSRSGPVPLADYVNQRKLRGVDHYVSSSFQSRQDACQPLRESWRRKIQDCLCTGRRSERIRLPDDGSGV